VTPDKRHNCTYCTTDILSTTEPTGFHQVEWHNTTLHIHTNSSSPTGVTAPCGTSPDNWLPWPHSPSAAPPDPSAQLWTTGCPGRIHRLQPHWTPLRSSGQLAVQAAFIVCSPTGPVRASPATNCPGSIHPPAVHQTTLCISTDRLPRHSPASSWSPTPPSFRLFGPPLHGPLLLTVAL